MQPNKLARSIHERLLNYYGYPAWRNPLPALDEIISTILSQNTNDTNRDRAYSALKKRFSSWEAVRDAEPGEVIETIRSAGLANQKGLRIQNILQKITAERGNLELDFLNDLTEDEARNWLLSFKGIGPKTAAIVLQFSLNTPAFPVDTHIYRVSGRLGLRPTNMNAEKAHKHLEGYFSPDTYYAVHLNMIRLGREICHPRQPDCPLCPLRDLCDFYEKSSKGKNGNEALNEV